MSPKPRSVASAQTTMTSPAIGNSSCPPPLACECPSCFALPPAVHRAMSLANAVKVVAVALLLVAFGQVIVRIVDRAWRVLAKVPVEVYQAAFASTTLAGLVASPQVVPAHAFSVALLSCFAFLLTAQWVVSSHPAIVQFAQRLKQRGWPVHTTLWHAGILSFAALALLHASRVFGLAAAVVYSAWNSFGVAYEPGTLTLGFADDGCHLSQAVVGHLAVLLPFSAAQAARALPARLAVFDVGVDYYLSIAFGIALLIGASPWRPLWDDAMERWADEREEDPEEEGNEPRARHASRAAERQRYQRQAGQRGQRRRCRREWPLAAYMVLTVLSLVVTMTAFFLTEVKSVGSVVCVCAVLLAMEWVAFYAHAFGFVAVAVAVGSMLYGTAMLIERLGQYASQ